MYDVKQFGAKGDRSIVDSPAFQAAIDTCHAEGGGTVVVHAGDYLLGSIELKSGVILQLEIGATLWASEQKSDYIKDWNSIYSNYVWFYAKNADHIGITGRGVIRGFATEKFGSWWGVPDHPELRVTTFMLEQCRHITMQDIVIEYSSFWTVHLVQCENVYVSRVNISNHRYHLNTDGIVPDSCRNVFISECHLITGDDCIPIKTTQQYACENIFISNCVMDTPNTAIKIGTESYGDFQNIHVNNCSVINASIGIGLFIKDGGKVEHVHISGLTLQSSDLYHVKPVLPLVIDIEQRHTDSRIGQIKDIILRDLFMDTQSSVLLQGMPESILENITLQNITMRISGFISFEERKKPVTGKRTLVDQRDTEFISKPAYLALAYCKDVVIDNLKVYLSEELEGKADRHVIYAAKTTNLEYKNVQMMPHALGGIEVVKIV